MTFWLLFASLCCLKSTPVKILEGLYELFFFFSFSFGSRASSELFQPCYPGTAMAMGDIAKRRHVCGKWGGKQAVTYHYSTTHSHWMTWREWKVRRQENESMEQKIYSRPRIKTDTRPLATPSLGNLLLVFLFIRQTREDESSWQGFTAGLWKQKQSQKDVESW